jgi:hypothetical protein
VKFLMGSTLLICLVAGSVDLWLNVRYRSMVARVDTLVLLVDVSRASLLFVTRHHPSRRVVHTPSVLGRTLDCLACGGVR